MRADAARKIACATWREHSCLPRRDSSRRPHSDGVSELPRRGTCLALLAAVFAVSRLLFYACGVRFDAVPLDSYWQYVDPALLRTDFWRSIFYLEQQPPAFNVFLGAILHLFPSHPEIGFQLIYLGLGLILSISLFELMNRMGVHRGIALATALIFTLSPSTVLYENLLFYEYPLTVLFAVAALFLHRFATTGTLLDGLVFFSSLALIAGIRSIYNLIWFVLLVSIALLALRGWRRRTVLAAALPALLLASVYLKHFIVFHNFVPGGRVFAGINFCAVLTDPVPDDDLDRLIASGKITALLKTDLFDVGNTFDVNPEESPLSRIVPVPPKTGIPVLDDCVKSTRAFNWNCVWAANLVQAYTKDARVVFRNYPGAYLESVADNLSRYFLPDTEGWPFDGRKETANQKVLSRPLAVYNLVTAGEWPPAVPQPWLAYVALPGLLGYGLFLVFSWLRSWLRSWPRGVAKKTCPADCASGLVLAFMVGNVIYLSAVVILVALADQNRYRSEMSAFYAVLLGLALSRIRKRSPGV